MFLQCLQVKHVQGLVDLSPAESSFLPVALDGLYDWDIWIPCFKRVLSSFYHCRTWKKFQDRASADYVTERF